jgi:hypothetical protein
VEKTSQQAIIPLEQALIPFHSGQVLAVLLPDDRMAATLNSLCALLGIRPESQARRVRRDKDLAEHLLLTVVETSGGLQFMDVLVAQTIPNWVMGLQLKRIPLEKRPLILALKVEIVDVLHRRFFPEEPTQSGPQSQSVPQPSSSRSESATAPRPVWERLFDGVHIIQEALYDMQQQEERKEKHLAQRFARIEEWLTSLDRRVAATGQANAAEPGWLPGLSQGHLADLRMLLRSLEQTTGCAALQLEQELVETFGTPTINAIADEQWQDVLAWGLWRAQQPR